MMTKSQKIGWGVSTVAALFVIVAGAGATWNTVGWTTPNQHAADIESIKQIRVVSEKAILEALEKNQDEWKCDEYDEELRDERKKLANASTPEEKAVIQHKIEKIKAAQIARKCSRFEDFG